MHNLVEELKDTEKGGDKIFSILVSLYPNLKLYEYSQKISKNNLLEYEDKICNLIIDYEYKKNY